MEWQNMRYSQEFKDNVVARLLSKELSISEAVERYSIGKSTISGSSSKAPVVKPNEAKMFRSVFLYNIKKLCFFTLEIV